MAENTIHPDLQIIKLCARLAKFAYTSGDPGSSLSLRQNNNEAAKTALLKEFDTPVPAFVDIANFQRYYSHSWFIPRASQPKWFRSYAYFCHIKGHADTRTESTEEGSGAGKGKTVDRIIVGFRGTWNDSNASGVWLQENGAENVSRKWLSSRMFTWIKHKLTPPSRYGLSDFYYDGMLIRVPYRKGTVWKWYAYWGSLVLERTEWAPRFFAWPRTVATDWITEPNINSSEPNGGHVHLGFWSLWASPEGFAGFDRQGHVSSEDSIITSVKQALASIKPDNVDIEVYVVGHSLGGAVSSFAALDIAKELEKYETARMYHVTFGAPPVGTAEFARYFRSQVGRRHRSWSISHERDLVSQCFTWCASKWYLGWLNWWGDWSCVGEKRLIRNLISPHSPIATQGNRGISIFEKCKLGMAGLGGLVVLYVLSLLAVPVSAVCYLRNRRYYNDKRNLQGSLEHSYRQDIPRLGPDVALEYHGLETYIDLLENEDDLVLELED